jgi:OOP family OmpA-OmpF porin
VVEPASAPVPAPVPAPEPVKCEPKVQTINISADTLFAFDKAKLVDTTQIDNEVVAKMKDNQIFASVRINGHTDRLGSDAYNQKLSEKRANAVRDYIISQGIDGGRLVAVGHGETTPLVECNNKGRKALIQCLAPNRRVEIEATRSEKTGCN